MKKKGLLLMLLCVILALGTAGLTGCGTGATTASGDGSPGAGGSEAGSGTEAAGTADAADQTYRVALYFANEAYIDTGDETLDKFNVHTEEITSTPEDVYRDTLELLKDPSNKNDSTMITDQVEFNDVYLEGDTVFVDIKSIGPNSGSTGESFLVSQIVDTLLNFDEVKKVQFLLNGEAPETLMGHVGTAEPFTKDVFSE